MRAGILYCVLALLLWPTMAVGQVHHIGPAADAPLESWQLQTRYQPTPGRIVQERDPRYDLYFDRNWRSIRTFKLLEPLREPIKVYVETRPADPGLYRPEYFDYVRQGLDAWANALDGRLKYSFTQHAGDAQIIVQWVPEFEEKYTAGDAITRFGHSNIRIKTVGLPQMDIKANIMHELGHALGINGHSENRDDIMVGMRHWTTDRNFQPRLSEGDIRAIRRLYSSDWRKGEDLYALDLPAPQIVASAETPLEAARSNAGSINVSDYVNEINRTINRKWRRPGGIQARPVVVSFEVNQDGQLIYSRIARSSGSRMTDQAALDTVEMAGPFKPFPKNFPPGSMLVESTLF